MLRGFIKNTAGKIVKFFVFLFRFGFLSISDSSVVFAVKNIFYLEIFLAKKGPIKNNKAFNSNFKKFIKTRAVQNLNSYVHAVNSGKLITLR